MDKTNTRRSASKSRKSAGGSDDGGSQVAHTLTACVRCRHRKTRCDPGLPRCTPCQKTNATCEYFDAPKGKNMSRNYVVHLQDRVKELEKELADLSVGIPQGQHNIDSVGRGVSVKIKEGDEYPRFLGPASGIAMTRLVLEMARDLWDAKSIKEVITEQKAQELKEKYQNESSKPTSKVYPLISFVAAPGLPSLELTEQLVQNYNLKSQYLYPVFHEPSFNKVVANVYGGSTDPYENFAVRLVVAISMQKLDSTYAGLADSYYLAALPYLDRVLVRKDLGTLQCLLLIALYSMTTPTRTAAYWVVGLATKLCQELRISDEATIGLDENNQPLDTLEVDLRRRCYWINLSFELGLAHILGRPSSFAISYDHVDVKPWQLVDDKYITRDGVKPGSLISMKKRISSHFMLMRLLQLEVRHTLYMKKREKPVNDSDPWFLDMERKMFAWMNSCPRNDEGSGISEIWFKVRWNTIVVFLFRPSPQVPEPSSRAAEKCFEASRFNIYIQKQQIETKSIDITWIFGQSLFMAINTILWTLSYPSIRKAHPKEEVEQHLQTALEGIFLVSQKWPGVESALDLYKTLAGTCLKAYERDIQPALPTTMPALTKPYQPRDQTPPYGQVTTNGSPTSNPRQQVHPQPLRVTTSSPAQFVTNHSRASSASVHTPPSQPIDIMRRTRELTPSYSGSPTSSVGSGHYPQAPTSNPFQNISQSYRSMPDMSSRHSYGTSMGPSSPEAQTPTVTTPTYGVHPDHRSSMNFNPHLYHNPLPDPLRYSYSPTAADSMIDRNVFYGSLGDPYAQLLHAEYFDPGQLEGLTLEQQSELLGNLEASGLGAQAQYFRPSSPAQSLFNGGYFTGIKTTPQANY